MPGVLGDETPYSSNTVSVARSAPSSYSSNTALTSRQSSEGQRKESWDPPTPALHDLPGGWPQTPLGLPNGGAKEGMGGRDGSVLSVPNGVDLAERAPSAKSLALSTRTRRSSGFDGDRKAGDKKAGEVVQDPAPRPGAAEEGYFTTAPIAKFAGPPRSPLAKASAPPVYAENAETTARRVVSGPLPTTPGSMLPPLKEISSPTLQAAARDQSLLKPPATKSIHRASSPPAFVHTTATPPISPNQLSPSPSRPGRLEQRHTLEVPLISTARVSTDTREPSSASPDGVASASGRFSPTTPSRRRGSVQLARRMTRSIHSHSDMQLDQVPLDEDASRFADVIRAKRASRKNRTDTDDDHVAVGTRVDEHHSNYIRAYNMLTGIRFVVSRLHGKSDRELTDDDFRASQKYSFDITGNELTPSVKYDFKFKDYSPWVFRHIRTSFGIDPAEYLVSLTAKYILSELGSPGKSGSFFYFSRDYKYIIKTIHHAEHKFLRKILKDYYHHVGENPNTLLSQFYGLHRVKLPYQKKVHFVIMNNLFPPHRDIHRTFDLKGSTIGRDFREEQLEKNPRATLKDLNWLRRNLHLEFGPTKRDNFVAQMQRDVALLQRLKIMDYSLLVGIHDLERGNDENLRDKTLRMFSVQSQKMEETPQMGALNRTQSKLESMKHAQELRNQVMREKPVPLAETNDKMPDESHRTGFYFYADDGGFQATHEDERPGDEIYYLGIIDCLTRYNYVKKAEHFWKGMGGHESQISPIPPDRYGERFVRFISGVTMSREQAEKVRLTQTLSSSHLPSGVDTVIDDSRLSIVSGSYDKHNPMGTEKVVERAEREAIKRQLAGETDVPDRTLHAVRDARGSGDHLEATTLPVIGEAQETGSNTSRTASNNITPVASREEVTTLNGLSGNACLESESHSQLPPPTPPKDGKHSMEFMNDSRGANGGPPPPTPPKDRSRGWTFDKDLPLPPVAADALSASPARKLHRPF
ncbi:Phosphatidylinositol-4-phosphate 5-kinase [Teratosphaeriaceae sp. CCFEE 6253]|nr:Phosphatidylinositol-4-phosphate 5-kinase [Teratosphaeriaceae sp. CCFEE 6253]